MYFSKSDAKLIKLLFIVKFLSFFLRFTYKIYYFCIRFSVRTSEFIILIYKYG